MNLSHTFDGETLMIYLKGDMDHCNISKLRNTVDEMIGWYRPKTLTLDYTNVPFMDSAGIGFVLGRIKKMYQIEGKITLINAKESIKKILELACVNKYANIM